MADASNPSRRTRRDELAEVSAERGDGVVEAAS
jgi:hypothetical protein